MSYLASFTAALVLAILVAPHDPWSFGAYLSVVGVLVASVAWGASR